MNRRINFNNVKINRLVRKFKLELIDNKATKLSYRICLVAILATLISIGLSNGQNKVSADGGQLGSCVPAAQANISPRYGFKYEETEVPGSVRQALCNYDTNYPPSCGGDSKCLLYVTSWLSVGGQPTQTTSNLIIGPTNSTQPLQLNHIVVVYHTQLEGSHPFVAEDGIPYSNNNGTYDYQRINDITVTGFVKNGYADTSYNCRYSSVEGSITGFSAGTQQTLQSLPDSRFWQANAVPFNYQASQAALIPGKSYTVCIKADVVPINTWYLNTTSQVSECVGDQVQIPETPVAPDPNAPTNYSYCEKQSSQNITPVYFYLKFTVPQPIPQPPSVIGTKLTSSGNNSGSFAGDTISVSTSNGTITSNGNPYVLTGFPPTSSSGTQYRFKANRVNGWIIYGYNYCYDTTGGCNPGYGPSGKNWHTTGNQSPGSAYTSLITVYNNQVLNLNWVYQACSTTSCVITSSNPCLPFAKQSSSYSDISRIPVNLSLTPTNPTSWTIPQDSSSGTPGVLGTYTTYNYSFAPNPVTVVGIIDSNPSTEVGMPNVTASLAGLGPTGSSTVYLNYMPYYQYYAYDPDTPVVIYQINYQETITSTTISTAYKEVCGPAGCSEKPNGTNTSYSSSTQNITTPEYFRQNGPTMPECFLRKFILTPNSSAAKWDNNEDPTQATYNAKVNVEFKESTVYDMSPYNQSISVPNYTYLRSVSYIKSSAVKTQIDPGICHQGTYGYYTSYSQSLLSSLYNQIDSNQLSPDCINPQPSSFAGLSCTLSPSSLPYFYRYEASPTYLQQPSSANELTVPNGNYNGYINVSANCPVSLDHGPNQLVYYGDSACFILSTAASQGFIDSTGTVQGTPIEPVAYSHGCSSPLEAKPYVQVFGGDVSAGVDSSQIDVCYEDKSNNGNIYANNTDSPDFLGSGTSLAAIARIKITGFASAQNDNTSSVVPKPKQLTFANAYTPPGSGYSVWGGDFADSSSGCSTSPDGYYDQLSSRGGPVQTNNPASLPTTSSINKAFTLLAAGTPGNYYWQVDGGTIKQPVTIYPGQHVVLYVKGPVLIDDNITYQMQPGGDTHIADLPSLMIINDGNNIGIANNVSEIDGTYVAEHGTIIDCAQYYVMPIAPIISQDRFKDARPLIPTATQTCSQQLIIRGAFIANTIDLYRTYGSIHDAQSTDSAGNSHAAEEFDFSPLEWLIPNQAQDLTPQQQVPLVQSITSLPPVL